MSDLIIKRLRQVLACGLLILLCASAAWVFVVPLSERLSNAAEGIERERKLLGGYQSVIAQREAVKSMEQQAEAARKSNLFIGGDTEAIRMAAVQSQLSDIMAANEVKPRMTLNLPTREKKGGVSLIGSQIQIAAPIAKVQKILLDIESHEPALFLDYVQMTQSPGSGASGEEDAGNLDVRFDVYAVAIH